MLGVDWLVCKEAQADIQELAQGKIMAHCLLEVGWWCGYTHIFGLFPPPRPRQPFGFQVPLHRFSSQELMPEPLLLSHLGRQAFD